MVLLFPFRRKKKYLNQQPRRGTKTISNLLTSLRWGTYANQIGDSEIEETVGSVGEEGSHRHNRQHVGEESKIRASPRCPHLPAPHHLPIGQPKRRSEVGATIPGSELNSGLVRIGNQWGSQTSEWIGDVNVFIVVATGPAMPERLLRNSRNSVPLPARKRICRSLLQRAEKKGAYRPEIGIMAGPETSVSYQTSP